MNFNKFTIKAQEAVQAALELAANNNQQAVEPIHVLKVMISDPESVATTVLKKMGIPLGRVNDELDSRIKKLPIVKGASVSGQYLSNESKEVFDKAQKVANEMGDEYMSSEHILVAMIENKGEVGRILRGEGLR